MEHVRAISLIHLLAFSGLHRRHTLPSKGWTFDYVTDGTYFTNVFITEFSSEFVLFKQQIKLGAFFCMNKKTHDHFVFFFYCCSSAPFKVTTYSQFNLLFLFSHITMELWLIPKWNCVLFSHNYIFPISPKRYWLIIAQIFKCKDPYSGHLV